MAQSESQPVARPTTAARPKTEPADQPVGSRSLGGRLDRDLQARIAEEVDYYSVNHSPRWDNVRITMHVSDASGVR